MNNIALDLKFNGVRSDVNSICNIEFLPISRHTLSWKDEIYRAATIIKNSTTKELYVCFSGGIDSEIICKVFLDLKIPFKVFTLSFTNNLNIHDIRYAKTFCESNGIDQIIYTVDPYEFFSKGVEKYIKQGFKPKISFRFLQLLLIDLIEELNGCAIMGGGEQLFSLNNDTIGINFTKCVFTPYIYLDSNKFNNKCHFPHFFYSTPELIYSYLQEKLIKYLLTNAELNKINSQWGGSIFSCTAKIIIVHSYFSDMIARPKFGGYEKIGNLLMPKYDNYNPDKYIFLSIDTILQQLTSFTNFEKSLDNSNHYLPLFC